MYQKASKISDSQRDIFRWIDIFDEDVSFLNNNGFILSSEFENLKNRYNDKYETIKSTRTLLHNKKKNEFIKTYENLDNIRESHNMSYIDHVIEKDKDYLDHILDAIDPNIVLDKDQRIAAVTDDDNCLIIAGAGSGKTTTVAAKVKYLTDKVGIPPQEILVISFTNKAVNELKGRINKDLKIPAEITTFHSFANRLIMKVDKKPTSIISGMEQWDIFNNILTDKIYHDRALLGKLVLFMGQYFNFPEEALERYRTFDDYCRYLSLNKFESLKNELDDYLQSKAEEGEEKNRTLKNETMRSEQEVQIANYLYMHNIEYVYEDPYPYNIEGSTKQYTPDFHIIQDDTDYWLEHYGISESGKNPLYSQQTLEKYKSGIFDKRAIHKHYNTKLMETWSTYDDGRPLIDHLEETLKSNRIIISERDPKEIFDKIQERANGRYIFKFNKMMITFIDRFKLRGYNIYDFDRLKQSQINVRTKMFLDLAKSVYILYQEALDNRDKIDFNDMINRANDCLDSAEPNIFGHTYRYIIIDEYQDIAKQRFNLTKKLSERLNTRIVAVGDDWQSIFAFAGADVSLFTDFKTHVGPLTTLKIGCTYRNSQELIDVAGKFITHNPEQIPKTLHSNKHEERPLRINTYMERTEDGSIRKDRARQMSLAVKSAVSEIVKDFGPEKTILFVGRYGFDTKQLISSGFFEQVEGTSNIICKDFPNVKITFLTIHSSKGLGFDNVVVLNMVEDTFGFPCKIEDDPVMRLVINDDDSVPYAEERRLMYVAMTRTKNRVYLVVPCERPSRFIHEIIEENNLDVPGLWDSIPDPIPLRCPICNFPLKYHKNGKYGPNLYYCTNEPEVCDLVTNSRECRAPVIKCDKCLNGYMFVAHTGGEYYYRCIDGSNKDKKGCGNKFPVPKQYLPKRN